MVDGFYWTIFISKEHEDLEIVYVENDKIWLFGIEQPFRRECFSEMYGPIQKPEILKLNPEGIDPHQFDQIPNLPGDFAP